MRRLRVEPEGSCKFSLSLNQLQRDSDCGEGIRGSSASWDCVLNLKYELLMTLLDFSGLWLVEVVSESAKNEIIDEPRR